MLYAVLSAEKLQLLLVRTNQYSKLAFTAAHMISSVATPHVVCKAAIILCLCNGINVQLAISKWSKAS